MVVFDDIKLAGVAAEIIAKQFAVSGSIVSIESGPVNRKVGEK